MTASSFRAAAARIALSAILAAGIGIGIYLVRHHENQLYGDASVVLGNCPETDTINCEVVNTSAWSELLGVPIAAFAIPTYLLVLGLTWAGTRRREPLAYAFGIGLLTALCSVILFWIAKTQVGFLCAWCMRLYAVNASIPVLAGLAAWRPPGALTGDALRDLRRWPRPMRFTAVAFAALLAATVAVQRGYRAELRREAAAARARIEAAGGPLVPAVPDEPKGDGAAPEATPGDARRPGDSSRLSFPWDPSAPTPQLAGLGSGLLAPAAPSPAPMTGPYKLAGPLRRVRGDKSGLRSEPLDLQSRLGKGRPLALLFWAPGFADSETALAELPAWLASKFPAFEVYAVSGKRADQKDEEIWERFSMIVPPPGVPLLVDDGFAVSTALATTDVPDLALFDGAGRLVVAKIKHVSQLLVSASGNVPAEDVIRKVASGVFVAQIKQAHPYYPADELRGACAPPFTAKEFGTGKPVTFSGRSAAGRPTLVVFWSSTCKHCQIEIPQLVAWVKSHPGAMDVVSVTRIKKDNPGSPSHRKVTEAYIRSQGIPWPVLEDPDGAVNDLYRSISTPTVFVVSPEGSVTEIWYYAHTEGFEAAMDAALRRARSAEGACRAVPAAPRPRIAMNLTGADGKKTALASLVDRPSLVHFWATWCKPCVEELPALLRFRDHLEKGGTGKVILVSVEGEGAGPAIAAFQKKLGADLRSYHAPSGGIADAVDLSYRVPRTYLVSAQGEVLSVEQGNQAWDDPEFAEKVRSRLDVLGGAKAR